MCHRLSLLQYQDISTKEYGMKIDGRFWLTKDGENFLGNGRIELLEKIEQTGSINAAAKAMKMSYKAAWERINQMNTLAEHPIIERVTGGRGGGGTVLTPHAHELIATYKRFGELHRQFIERFAEAGDDPERLARILGRMFLTTSARNQLTCKVLSITEQGINGTMELSLKGGETLVTDITLKSIRSMGLVAGCDAYAIIKSSDVRIVGDTPVADISENMLEGKIAAMETSEEHAEITFETDHGTVFIAVIPREASMSLAVSQRAYALIARQHIILGL